MFDSIQSRWKKHHPGNFRRGTTKGTVWNFTSSGVIAIVGGELRLSQINAAVFALKKSLSSKGKFYCRVCPNYSVTKKPLKVKMGGGKGKFDHMSCFVRPGKVIFEVYDVDKEVEARALRICASKLPMKTIVRRDVQ